jgi:hypothetical protein
MAKTKVTEKTEEKPKVAATVIAAVVTLIKEWTGIQEKGDAIQLKIADTIRAYADKQGLDKSEVRPYVVLTYRAAYGMQDEKDEKVLLAFDRKQMGNVSRVMTLAFPASPQADKQLEIARDHNKTANGDRIGIHKLISIAGGRSTTEEILDKKATKKASGKASYPLASFKDDVSGQVSRYMKNAKGDKAAALEKVETFFDSLISDWTAKLKEGEAEAED